MKADDKVNRIVGANLKRLRIERQMTRVALAEKAGMDDSYVGKMERGQRGTTSGKYELLARALGVAVSELFVPSTSQRRSSDPSHA